MIALKQGQVHTNKSKLSPKQIKDIQSHVGQLISNEKLYLQKGYTLTELSRASGYTIHILSAVINKSEKKHFNDYLNQFRINYCLEYIEKNKAYSMRLEDLSAVCGFNNRNTFASAFKKNTGIIPSQYFKFTDV